MNMNRILWGFMTIAALALLAGCGGGGGTSLMVGGERATQDRINQLQSEHDRLQRELTAAMGTATTLRGQLNDANAEVTRLTGELATATGDVTTLRGQLTAAQAEVTRLMGELTTANNRISELTAMLPPTEDPDPARTKAAGTKRTAIAAEAAQTTDAGLGGSGVTATGNDEGAYNLAIERDRDGTTVTVTVEGATDDADEKFVQADDLGGGTTMHTRTMDADSDGNVVVEVAMVTTDIEAPKATAFGMVHTLDVRVDGETATTAMPNDALNVIVANLGHVKASAFTAPSGTTGTTVLSFQQAVADDAGTEDVDESRAAAEIMGTYEGAMGTYKCNADAACTVTVDPMGVVSAVSNANDWIFIPASGATIDVPDADYLHYGFWLKRTTDEDGVLEYNEVETFAGSSVPMSGTLAAVTGTATYNGGATGVYVHSVNSPEGTEVLATSGHFTANAELTATFGQVLADPDDSDSGTIIPNLLYTLTGTINDFQLSGHNQGPGWSVALDGDITGTNGSDGAASGTAKGGVGDGSFSATFHGSTDDGDGNATVKPSSVVGEFNAGFSNGSVAGAFGARR